MPIACSVEVRAVQRKQCERVGDAVTMHREMVCCFVIAGGRSRVEMKAILTSRRQPQPPGGHCGRPGQELGTCARIAVGLRRELAPLSRGDGEPTAVAGRPNVCWTGRHSLMEPPRATPGGAGAPDGAADGADCFGSGGVVGVVDAPGVVDALGSDGCGG